MINKIVEKGARKLPLLDARNVPSQIIGIIAKCLYFEKKDRYGDAQELFHQIEGVFQELENKAAGMESADSIKPFKSWSASEVAELVRSIGSAFADKANQIDANGIDGEYFLAMLKNHDPDLTTSDVFEPLIVAVLVDSIRLQHPLVCMSNDSQTFFLKRY